MWISHPPIPVKHAPDGQAVAVARQHVWPPALHHAVVQLHGGLGGGVEVGPDAGQPGAGDAAALVADLAGGGWVWLAVVGIGGRSGVRRFEGGKAVGAIGRGRGGCGCWRFERGGRLAVGKVGRGVAVAAVGRGWERFGRGRCLAEGGKVPSPDPKPPPKSPPKAPPLYLDGHVLPPLRHHEAYWGRLLLAVVEAVLHRAQAVLHLWGGRLGRVGRGGVGGGSCLKGV